MIDPPSSYQPVDYSGRFRPDGRKVTDFTNWPLDVNYFRRSFSLTAGKTNYRRSGTGEALPITLVCHVGQ
jgi:hypothetical protein